MGPESTFNKVKEKFIMETGFSFTRLSSKTKGEFIEYANKEFADDYGAAFTHIWKFFKGECSSGHEEIDLKIDTIAAEISKLSTRIESLEENKSQENSKQRLDGSTPEQRTKNKEMKRRNRDG